MLLYYLDELEATCPMLLYYNKEPKRFLMDFIVNNPDASLKKAIQALGLRILLEDMGIREFREIIRNYKRSSWYKLNHEIQNYTYPEERPFEAIRKAIELFIPLKLIDFQDKMINNDKYSL